MKNKDKSIDSIEADHLRRLTQIGVALSAEKDINRLLEKILTEARTITNADGGTLYMMSDNAKELHFAIVQNESLGLSMGGTGDKMTWPSLKLVEADGSSDHAHVSSHVATTGEVVNISDVYDPGFHFEGPREFDHQTGYLTQSMLVVPMRNHENDIIGVLQLINSKDAETDQVVPFSGKAQELALSLASQAAVALTKNRLIVELENLLDAFIQTIAIAIDEKSPYTGGHVRRVVDLTMNVAERITQADDGHFASTAFSDDEMEELRIAAWLHDIGKITTPEHVVDKATRLEKVYDRIEDVKLRFELLKREYQMAIKNAREKSVCHPSRDAENEIKALDEEYQFLVRVNKSTEPVEDETIDRIRQIAQRQWSTSGQTLPLLTEDEIYNLSIRHGTLNDQERNIINNHVAVTYKILAKLPFPRKLQKIAEYAAAHHEKLDGSGYPLGLKGKQLPLQSRIIAMADIFEALTAKDRPYKKEKTLREALTIMQNMVEDQHIDADLYELFVQEKIYRDYAVKELTPQQIDM